MTGTELATTGKPDLVQAMAAGHGLSHDDFWSTISQMAGCKDAATPHFIGLLLQAKRLGLDPIARQLYLMPTKKGIQVVIPVDGYLQLMRNHADFVSFTVKENHGQNPSDLPVSATVTIYTKGQLAAKTPPFEWTEYMAECRIENKQGPWTSHPARMLKHKAVSQAVRYCFAIYAPDEGEWQRAEEVESGLLPAPPAEGSKMDQLTESLPAVTPADMPPLSEEAAREGAPPVIDVKPDPFDAEESRRMDAEDAAREAEPDGKLS